MVGLSVLVLVGACDDEDGVRPERAASTFMLPTLNTFVNKALEIDHLGANCSPNACSNCVAGTDPTTSRDANLFLGVDPADNSCSVHFPASMLDFIDWDDLGTDLANHRLQDLADKAGGIDPTTFPQKNQCIGPHQIPDKDDLLYVGASSNQSQVYFAWQRRANVGDTGIYSLFTKVAPFTLDNDPACTGGGTGLYFSISGATAASDAGPASSGDVLLFTHFSTNGTKLLRIFKAAGNHPNVSAIDATDFTNTMLWTEVTNLNVFAAVNDDTARNGGTTDPGSFGAAQVKNLTAGGDLEKELFVEGAVPLSVFGGTGCNTSTQYYGSFISRSSGSGGGDMDDFVMGNFNFGGGSVTASVTPAACSLSATFSATVKDASDTDVTSTSTCTWTFDDNTTATGCTGVSHTFATAGSHSGTVSVAISGCPAVTSQASTTLYAPLSYTINTKPNDQSCTGIEMTSGALTVGLSVSGGSGSYAYSWTYSACNSSDPMVPTGPTCTVSPPTSDLCVEQDVSVDVTDTGHAGCTLSRIGPWHYEKLTTSSITQQPSNGP